jgi:hypothetical protein
MAHLHWNVAKSLGYASFAIDSDALNDKALFNQFID